MCLFNPFCRMSPHIHAKWKRKKVSNRHLETKAKYCQLKCGFLDKTEDWTQTNTCSYSLRHFPWEYTREATTGNPKSIQSNYKQVYWELSTEECLSTVQ